MFVCAAHRGATIEQMTSSTFHKCRNQGGAETFENPSIINRSVVMGIDRRTATARRAVARCRENVWKSNVFVHMFAWAAHCGTTIEQIICSAFRKRRDQGARKRLGIQAKCDVEFSCGSTGEPRRRGVPKPDFVKTFENPMYLFICLPAPRIAAPHRTNNLFNFPQSANSMIRPAKLLNKFVFVR